MDFTDGTGILALAGAIASLFRCFSSAMGDVLSQVRVDHPEHFESAVRSQINRDPPMHHPRELFAFALERAGGKAATLPHKH